ncbi:MAG: Gldg family protein, partial [bacterium]
AETLVAGTGSAGLVVEKGRKYQTIPLIQVINLPLFGTQYQLADMNQMEERLGEVIDDVIDINKKIGYLVDHGTLPVSAGGGLPGQNPQLENLTNFNRIVSEDYSFVNVRLKEEGIPEGIDCLVIAGPKEQFSDYALFQIDQFLMKGKSLAIFLDSFNEIIPSQDQMRRSYNQGPIYLPLNTGLEKLLEHYGASVEKSYVLDENCFEQRIPQVYGGGKRAIYFAPIIKNEFINRDLGFMRGIKALVTVKSSPLDLKEDTIELHGLESDVLFSSSSRSWIMSGRISLNPWEMRPPEDQSSMESHPLAVLVQGDFPSYFAGKEIPEKPAEEEAEAEGEADPAEEAGETGEAGERPDESQQQITGEGTIVERGRAGKIFLIGTAEVLKNNVIDENGTSPNATFVMNLIDHLNGRDEYATMRSKMLRFNPLQETSGGTKTFVKSFNIAGLPVIVVAFGIAVWFRRTARKRAIQMMFRQRSG